MKFGLKNDLAPNYQNNLYCNLSQPKTETMFRAAQSSESTSLIEEKGTSCEQLWGWAAEALQLSPNKQNSGGFLCPVTAVTFHLISIEQLRLSATSGQCFHLKGWYTLPNKYINEAVLL